MNAASLPARSMGQGLTRQMGRYMKMQDGVK
eukprot:CAMPEP_0118948602 /NCGR_PEP_ID=MMETSP1169-20130426/48140_1 /TAXON_ID=36882 /ORGANISM="Pyramimonas obovata, Strain CCMP722" /LENGTH=30 /DNA_ID= /DNA_START= /DNA_END= /DNA_ORIENTATION=